MRETKHRTRKQRKRRGYPGIKGEPTSKQPFRMVVSWRALLGRVSRALEKRGEKLVCPKGRAAVIGVGDYYTIGESLFSLRNLGVGRGVVVGLAKKLGVLREWERVETGEADTGGRPNAH